MSNRDQLPEAGVLVDEQERVICARCVVATRLRDRTRGLLRHRSLPAGEGLLIARTSSIHTFFMRFPIDAVFLDRDLRVRAVVRAVRPFRVSWRPGSRNVLELAAGEAARVGLERGSRLSWHDRGRMIRPLTSHVAVAPGSGQDGEQH